MAHGVIKFTASAIVVGAALYAGIGYMGVPYATHTVLDKFVVQKLQRPVRLDRVSFNPWTLKYEISGLSIPAQDGSELLSLRHLFVDASWRSLTALAPILDAVSVDGLVVNAKMDEALHADLEALAGGKASQDAAAAPASEAEESSGALPRFALYNISITDSAITYQDPKAGITQSITEVNAKLPFVSTLESSTESLLTPALSMKLNGTPIEASGSTKPFGSSLEAQLRLNIHALDLVPLSKLVPQLSGQSGGLTLADGKLTSDLTFVFRNPTGGEPAKMLLAGNAAVDGFRANLGTGKNAATVAQLQKARLVLKELNLVDQKADVASVALDGLKLDLTKSKQGINLAAALGAAAPEGAAQPAAPEESAPQAASSAWQWRLGEASLSNAAIRWRDSTVSPAADISLSGLQASLKNLSSDGAPGRFTLTGSTLSGTIALSGTAGLAPLSVSVAAKGDKLSVKHLAGYIRSATGLDVGATANFSVEANYSESAQVVSGSAAISGISVKKDKRTWATVSSVEAKVKGIDLLKRSADLDRIAVNGAVVNAVKTASGLNFAELGGAEPAPNQPAAAPAKPERAADAWSWRIGTAAVAGSTLNLRDETLKPAASTQISRLNVTLKNISSAPGAESAADLSAGAAGGSINAAGKFTLSPLKADLELEAQKLQLKAVSPFLAGYAGLGAKNGQFDVRGRVTATSSKENKTNFAWKGDVSLANLELTNAKGRGLMSWKKASLAGMDVTAPDPFALRIAKAQIDNPAQKQTETVKQIAGIASIFSALAGKEERAEKIAQTADKLSGSIVMTNIRYENGRLRADELNALGQTILDKLSDAVAEKFPAAAPQASPQNAREADRR